MTITPEQRAARRSTIGSSDTPPILAVDPWRNAGDVYLSKVFELEDLKETEPIELGNDFEAPLLRWAARELGIEITPNVSLVSGEDPLFSSNLDARATDPKVRVGLEAKFSGDGDSWGSEGTDEIPDRVIAQATHQIFVAELDVVWVPVLTVRFGRPKRLLFKVERNDNIIAAIRDEGHAFWEGHVIPRIPPPDRLPDLETLKRVRRIPYESTEVSPELVLAWDQLRQARLEAEKAEKSALEELLTAIGDAEAGDYGADDKLFTYREQGKKYVPAGDLRRLYPEIAAELEVETRFRVPRIQKRK